MRGIKEVLMKNLSTALLLALLTATCAWAAPAAPLACSPQAQQPAPFLETPQPTNASSWCQIWCPSPPYAMNWYIACEANYCGTTYMSCVGGYSLSCEQCQDAYQNGGPQCYY
jgi:hypothetical protein